MKKTIAIFFLSLIPATGLCTQGPPADRSSYVIDASDYDFVANRRIYVMDSAYMAGRLRSGIRKSKCLELASSPEQADVLLYPVDRTPTIETGYSTAWIEHHYTWILVDVKSHKRIGDWSMQFFPGAGKVEKAMGCSK
jgi:hypothetical protein